MSLNHCAVCAQCKQHPCSCIQNYWIIPSSGTNTLKGCECDPENPIVLQDCYIIYAIEHSQKARDDFCKLYPSLFPCEKDRFEKLFTDNPALSKLISDCQTSNDTFQRRMNKIPVHTVGKYGGIGAAATKINLPPHFAPKSQPKGCV